MKVNFVYEGLLGTAYIRSHVKLTALMLYLSDDGSLTIRVTLAQKPIDISFPPLENRFKINEVRESITV